MRHLELLQDEANNRQYKRFTEQNLAKNEQKIAKLKEKRKNQKDLEKIIEISLKVKKQRGFLKDKNGNLAGFVDTFDVKESRIYQQGDEW